MAGFQTILRRITASWAIAQHLLKEAVLLHQAFPTKAQLLSKKSKATPFLRLASRLHLRKAQASCSIIFELSGDEVFSADPTQVVAEITTSSEVDFGVLEYVILWSCVLVKTADA